VPCTYTVKEIFYTLQGEGAQAGTPAVFVRFSGCNLWSGREEDRGEAVCQFCDTEFVGVGPDGGRFDAVGLARAARASGPSELVVCTGGEPLLQLDGEAIDALHAEGFRVAVETNGTVLAPEGIDWICVSPKAGSEWVQRAGDELKLVYPQVELMPDCLPLGLAFEHYFLQPMDGPCLRENTEAAIAFCLANPKWRLSVQTHKVIGLR
jgi:7-carboxy-7-deazaguanine synthase (Cx14CxxC type)